MVHKMHPKIVFDVIVHRNLTIDELKNLISLAFGSGSSGIKSSVVSRMNLIHNLVGYHK